MKKYSREPEDNAYDTERGSVDVSLGIQKSSKAVDLLKSSNVRGQRILPLTVGIAGLIAIGVGVFFYLNNNNLAANFNSQEAPNFQGKVYEADLMAHNQTTDCWLLIGDTVYDLTAYAPKHPGGSLLITSFCGTNSTEEYLLEHPLSLMKTLERTVIGTYETNVDIEEQPEAPQALSLSTPAPTSSAPVSAPTTSCTESTYTMNTIALHNNANDCWQAIYDVVYDFTEYANLHTGGASSILPNCGTDATMMYEAIHSSKEILKVKKYIIGSVGSTDGTIPIQCKRQLR